MSVLLNLSSSFGAGIREPGWNAIAMGRSDRAEQKRGVERWRVFDLLASGIQTPQLLRSVNSIFSFYVSRRRLSLFAGLAILKLAVKPILAAIQQLSVGT
jgi:hypothetical protein